MIHLNQSIAKLMNSVSLRINQIKEKFDLNNVELGKIAGVSKAAVGKWLNEGAKPSSDVAVTLREKLGIDETWLISGKGEMLASREDSEYLANVAAISEGFTEIQKEKLLDYGRYLAIKDEEPHE